VAGCGVARLRRNPVSTEERKSMELESTQPVTDEQAARLRQLQREAEAELARRLAEGNPGDQPDELTPEDEALLLEIWSQPKGRSQCSANEAGSASDEEEEKEETKQVRG
jgi:hypothetical protein